MTEQSNKHTQGPLTTSVCKDQPQWGKCVVKDGTAICWFTAGYSKTEQSANADLFAAAPNLLATLVMIRDHLAATDSIVAECNKAIAKAEPTP